MEGAAVAQVAEQEGVPWLVLRVISDGADEAAAESFEDFVKRYEQQAWRLIEALLQRCNPRPQAHDALLNRLLRYGLVGGTAAAVHIGVLLLLGQWMSLSLANPIAGRLCGGLSRPCPAHLPGRDRRSPVRPALAAAAVRGQPQCLRPAAAAQGANAGAGVHTHAAECPDLEPSSSLQCQARQNQNGQPPLLHADDLPGVDAAILDSGGSLLVNGPSARC